MRLARPMVARTALNPRPRRATTPRRTAAMPSTRKAVRQQGGLYNQNAYAQGYDQQAYAQQGHNQTQYDYSQQQPHQEAYQPPYPYAGGPTSTEYWTKFGGGSGERIEPVVVVLLIFVCLFSFPCPHCLALGCAVSFFFVRPPMINTIAATRLFVCVHLSS